MLGKFQYVRTKQHKHTLPHTHKPLKRGKNEENDHNITEEEKRIERTETNRLKGKKPQRLEVKEKKLQIYFIIGGHRKKKKKKKNHYKW